MPLNITIDEEIKNDVLHRRELAIHIDHSKGGTPTRVSVRDQIAAQLTKKKDTVYVITLKTRAGTRTTKARIHVYDSEEYAKKLEPAYIHLRNNPPAKPDESQPTTETVPEKQPEKPEGD